MSELALALLSAVATFAGLLAFLGRRDLSRVVIVDLAALSVGVLGAPPTGPAASVLAALAIFHILLMLPAGRGAFSRLAKRIERHVFAVAVLACSLAFVEVGAFLLTQAGMVRPHAPMVTFYRLGSRDDRDWLWRMPDPELFWRPRPGMPPFNGRGFIGREVSPRKAQGVVRVVTMGDSLTEWGCPGGTPWPQLVERVLSRVRPTEVVNAGVSGYSSHQGLLYFRECLASLRPDLVLLCFGCNDAASTFTTRDSLMPRRSAFFVRVERTLLRYRCYLLLKRLSEPSTDTTPKGPRVTIEEFIENYRAVLALAREAGVQVVFLTKPHRRDKGGPRPPVSAYNDALRSLAQSTRVAVLDAESHFATQSDDLWYDSCHLNPTGLVAMARFVSRGVLEAGLLR